LAATSRSFVISASFPDLEERPLAWTLALLVSAFYASFAIRNVPPVARTWAKPTWLKLVVFPAAVAAATVEEAFFRRSVMDAVWHMEGGGMLQVAASSVAFGIPHSVFGLMKGNLAAAVRASVATGLLGALLAVVYLVGRRSLAPCIVAHFLITFVLEPGLLLAAVTGEWRFRRPGTDPMVVAAWRYAAGYADQGEP
jgi:membrane protease YdiL (CAAX protease family)